jgi:hypothetical protein
MRCVAACCACLSELLHIHDAAFVRLAAVRAPSPLNSTQLNSTPLHSTPLHRTHAPPRADAEARKGEARVCFFDGARACYASYRRWRCARAARACCPRQTATLTPATLTPATLTPATLTPATLTPATLTPHVCDGDVVRSSRDLT